MATRQYIGARYVPKFYENGEWTANTAYEALTIVTRNGNSYTSKKPVPATIGAPESNPDYWVSTGIYNTQVEQYRQEVEEYKTETDAAIETLEDNINDKLDIIGNPVSLRGKRSLIIGDSFAFGWNGTQQVTSWTDRFATRTGMTCDVIGNRGSGFVSQGSSPATYPNETFIQLLEHVKDNEYDVILVQGCSNDINYANTTNIGPAIDAFWNKVKQYWGEAKYYFVPLYTVYMIPYAKRGMSSIIYMRHVANGINVCKDALTWMTFRTVYEGNDIYHFNEDGYAQIGDYISAWVNGWNGELEKSPVMVSNLSSASNTALVPEFNTDLIKSGYQYQFEINKNIVAFTLIFTFVDTLNVTNGDLVSGLPNGLLDYQRIDATWVADQALPVPNVIPRRDSDRVTISGLTSGMAGKQLRVQGHYHINLNYLMT